MYKRQILSGWERKDAAKFSFLLGIPSISLVAFVEFFSSINQFSTFPFLPLLVGVFTTFIFSLLAIDFLIKYISSNGLKIFIYYRLVFGILILLSEQEYSWIVSALAVGVGAGFVIRKPENNDLEK